MRASHSASRVVRAVASRAILPTPAVPVSAAPVIASASSASSSSSSVSATSRTFASCSSSSFSFPSLASSTSSFAVRPASSRSILSVSVAPVASGRRSFFGLGGDKKEEVVEKPANNGDEKQQQQQPPVEAKPETAAPAASAAAATAAPASTTTINGAADAAAALAAADAAEKAAAAAKQKAENDALRKQVTEKDAKIAELTKQLQYAVAEQQNIRFRSQNDVKAAHKFATQGFAKSLLEVADTLELAISSVAKEIEQAKQDATLKDHHIFQSLLKLAEGVELTDKVLAKSFASNHVKKFESLGLKFDPNLHDGVFQFEDPTKTPGTVGQVVKSGYTLNDRVLRPAIVGTVKAPSTPPPTA